VTPRYDENQLRFALLWATASPAVREAVRDLCRDLAIPPPPDPTGAEP
jgi:hypothetical protein